MFRGLGQWLAGSSDSAACSIDGTTAGSAGGLASPIPQATPAPTSAVTGTCKSAASSACTKDNDTAATDLSRLRVCIVDDVPLNLKVLDRQLRRIGVASIVQCSDGLELCAAEAAEVFDLVICDLQMPVMSGTEAAAYIVGRHTGGCPAANGQPPIAATAVKCPLPYLVALTASEGAEERCMAAGFHVVLVKPAGAAELWTAIRGMMAYKHS
jgi:CheY-like chemotaxis protein